VTKGVVLLSGGLDSAVTAWIAKRECEELFALSFDYGQSHSVEQKSAKLLGEVLGVSKHLFFSLPLHDIGGSSLFGEGEIPAKGLSKGIPTTWVPQRNAIFCAIAFGWAEVVGADKVYIGVNVIDYSGYPDCRPEFIRALCRALNLASKRFVETGSGICLVTPIIDLTKKEIISLGLKLGVPLRLCWSCYQGGETPCGLCDSCRIRAKAFGELGVEDPALRVGGG